MSQKPTLKIDWASHEAAKFACVNWHYSKCLPIGKLVKVGVWEDSKYIGCKTVATKGVRQTLDEVRKHLDPKAENFYTLGKHCYIMPLDKQIRKNVEHLSRPYPKRTKEQALGDQPSLGGATPTCTLQPNG